MLKDGMCSVYSSRPLLCNVKELSKEIAEELNSDVKAMYALNAVSCNSLISSYGLDPQFMIDLSQFQ
jgi:Fe-S-cluster containining protein